MRGILMLTALLAMTSTAQASPNLTVGIAGNQYIDSPGVATATSEGLGAYSVRVFVDWHGEAHVTQADRNRLASLTGRKSLITITGVAATAPLSAATRKVYANYVAEVVALFHPWAVSVWNEPNLSAHWPRNRRGPEDYERLLARTYDAAKKADPKVKVLGGETVRSTDVAGWIRRMGREYRISNRHKPLMDGFAHHPYPVQSKRHAWGSARHDYALWIVQGDVARMRVALSFAFKGTKQKGRTPIYWTETGWATGAPDHLGSVSVTDQATRMRDAVELAYCQRRVKGIFFFELWDDVDELGTVSGWQTGVLYSDGSRKPSYAALASTISNVNAGNVDCSRFPKGSL